MMSELVLTRSAQTFANTKRCAYFPCKLQRVSSYSLHLGLKGLSDTRVY
jgi:hypothetical protein